MCILKESEILANGKAIDMANGKAIDMANGKAIDMANGKAIDMANGKAIDMANGKAIDMASILLRYGKWQSHRYGFDIASIWQMAKP
jgi:fructose 1,6-bisphosphatase